MRFIAVDGGVDQIRGRVAGNPKAAADAGSTHGGGVDGSIGLFA